MASVQHNTWADRLKLGIVLTAMLLTPALLILFFYALNDLHHQGWRLVLPYLTFIAGSAFLCGLALYRLSILPASPARRTLDRLLAMLCVTDCGLAFLTAIHPHDAESANALLTFTIFFVALSLCGLYWPPDALPHATHRTRIPRWLRQTLALPLIVSPLPLAIWLTRIDWLRFAKGSTEYELPRFVWLALLSAMYAGLRWTDRIGVGASRRESTGAAALTPFESPPELPEAGTGERGVLVSRSTTSTRRKGMHGDLWLFPTGLLRIPLGWPKTLACVG
jgi:hypothetical protein